MKLDVNALRYLSADDFRVLTSIEMGQKNVSRTPPFTGWGRGIMPNEFMQLGSLQSSQVRGVRCYSGVCCPAQIGVPNDERRDSYHC